MGIYASIVIGLALAAWTVFRADYPIHFSLADSPQDAEGKCISVWCTPNAKITNGKSAKVP